MPDQRNRSIFFATIFLGTILLGAISFSQHLLAVGQSSAPRWWKGNLHTHSFWSDGDDFPEMIVDWYKKHGYNFLALSDHNTLQQGQRWIDVPDKRQSAVDLYVKRFGTNWVEQRSAKNKPTVRLKQLGEFRTLFEEPNRFLLVPSEEISDHFGNIPIHLNASNLRELIKPQGGKSVLDVMQNNVNAVLEQRQRTGQPMMPHLNHPNFHWAVTAEDLMQLKGEKFFEVYNGHPGTRTLGDGQHASTERIWDIILTWRLSKLGLDPMFALATDDSHFYHKFDSTKSNPGRGWVMVKMDQLTPEKIVQAMEAGDFYASTGVRLKKILRDPKKLSVEVEPESGVNYKIQFIGTRTGFDSKHEPIRDGKGELRTTQHYSEDIGKIFSETSGTAAVYKVNGDEIYVRAKIISSRPKANPSCANEFEVAWTQPLVTGIK